MDLRGHRKFLFAITMGLSFFDGPSIGAQEILNPTEITGSPVDELGSRRTTRPTDVITQDQIQSDIHPLDDALNSLPGIQSRLNGSPTISIRGSLSSSRTLVFTDGAPLNFADGVGFNPLFIATENLDRVTLLRGPASTLFGHDALSGALEFDSEKLTRPKFFESYGSFNTSQTFAGAPFKIGDTHAQLTAYQTHGDGNYPYTSQEGFSGVRARNDQEILRATFSASQSGSDFIQFKTYHLIGRQIGSTPGALDFPSASSINNWNELSYLGVNINLNDSFKIGTRSTYKYIHLSSFNLPWDEQSFHQGISLEKKIGSHEIELFDDVSFEEYLASSLGSGQDNDTLNEYGVSDFILLTDYLTLQPAFRFSNESGGVIPSLGLIDVFNQWKIFANYSEGFHPPSISQKYSQTPQVEGNPNLSPEHSTEIDFGVEKNFQNSLAGRLEVFDRNIYNLFGNSFVSTGVLMPQNVGHGHAQGAELSLESQGSVNGGINLSYLNNVEVETGSPIPLSPRVQASMHITKAFGYFSGTIQDTYWSDYYDQSFLTGGLVDLNSWNTFDIYLAAKVYKDINLKFSALNIFDQPRELTLSYPEPRRAYAVMLQGYL